MYRHSSAASLFLPFRTFIQDWWSPAGKFNRDKVPCGLGHTEEYDVDAQVEVPDRSRHSQRHLEKHTAMEHRRVDID